MASRLSAYNRLNSPQAVRRPATAANGFVAWMLLIGVVTPATMTIFIGGAKFIPGRIVICLLLFPALFELFRKGRHLVASDLFACLASAWIIGATFDTDPESWSSGFALVVEFLGGYIVARAFFFGRPAVQAFVGALKFVAVVVIALAALEHLTQHIVTYNVVAALWGLPSFTPEYRYGLLRAFSTFPHPILYGTFCVVAGAIFLYSERSFLGRFLYTGGCFFGCVLAVSSAPLISFMIVISVYFYDRIMRRYSWRWDALVTGLCVLLVAVFALANKPVSWIVSHLTLDPSTGYFRVATWDSAFYYIGLSPYVGFGFEAHGMIGDFFGNASVDSVWLALALRFGIPAIVFLFLSNVATFYRSGSTGVSRQTDPYMSRMRTAFTLVLIVFMFAGLTVHYWNNIWMFWGICIGIRGSLQEEYLGTARSAASERRQGWSARARHLAIGSPQITSHRMQGFDGRPL
jgi:hypothetical protein